MGLSVRISIFVGSTLTIIHPLQGSPVGLQIFPLGFCNVTQWSARAKRI